MTIAGDMREAAAVLLATPEGARAAAAFTDDAARRWIEYRPRPRPGLSLADLGITARKAAHRLLATALSPPAYAQAMTVLALEEMGIPVEYLHHEVGPSQHEIDIRYADALQMADHCMTYRSLVKEVAQRHGLHATFMPKPLFGENGSGMHTHMSLFSEGRNAFFDGDDEHQRHVDAEHLVAQRDQGERDEPGRGDAGREPGKLSLALGGHVSGVRPSCPQRKGLSGVLTGAVRLLARP